MYFRLYFIIFKMNSLFLKSGKSTHLCTAELHADLQLFKFNLKIPQLFHNSLFAQPFLASLDQMEFCKILLIKMPLEGHGCLTRKITFGFTCMANTIKIS